MICHAHSLNCPPLEGFKGEKCFLYHFIIPQFMSPGWLGREPDNFAELFAASRWLGHRRHSELLGAVWHVIWYPYSIRMVSTRQPSGNQTKEAAANGGDWRRLSDGTTDVSTNNIRFPPLSEANQEQIRSKFGVYMTRIER